MKASSIGLSALIVFIVLAPSGIDFLPDFREARTDSLSSVCIHRQIIDKVV